jgi:hypothetical protein
VGASRFGWDDLMIEGVLGPLHAGQEVHYQPPAWPPHGRTGHIDVAAGTSTVIVEGVGASRRQLTELVDVVVWVQSDFDQARRLGVRRNVDQGLDPTVAQEKWREWQAEGARSWSSPAMGTSSLHRRERSDAGPRSGDRGGDRAAIARRGVPPVPTVALVQ